MSNPYFEAFLSAHKTNIAKEALARVTGVGAQVITCVGYYGKVFVVNLLGKNFTHKITPIVGDYVILNTKIPEIKHIIERTNTLKKRKKHSKSEAQEIAANVDVVLVFTVANSEFNLANIQKMLIGAYQINATPIIILNKIDLDTNYQQNYVHLLQKVLPNVQVLPISVTQQEKRAEVLKLFVKGLTYIVIGSSGFGKSSFVNMVFSKDLQKTSSINHKSNKGVHTTTSRDLLFHEDGFMLIDTPGVREFSAMLDNVENIEAFEKVFTNVIKFAKKCTFRDCRHDLEKDCAVKRAIKEHKLIKEELDNYKKIKTEILENHHNYLLRHKKSSK